VSLDFPARFYAAKGEKDFSAPEVSTLFFVDASRRGSRVRYLFKMRKQEKLNERFEEDKKAKNNFEIEG
jgi:hypothetical protein